MEPGTRDDVRRAEFEQKVEQSIEEGLREILGQSGLQMVLSHHPLKRLSADPEALHEVLQKIFMDNGALIIEREVARRLLDKVGKERAGEGRLHRWWLPTAASGSKGPGRASASEKRVLRQFVALATLPQGHRRAVQPGATGGISGATSIEFTSLRFADAFKKGS